MIKQEHIRLLFQLSGWVAVVAIGILSLVPGDMRPHTGAPGEIEHVAAYLGTAGLLTFGYGEGRRPLAIVLSLGLYSAAFEILQILIPGRHPAFLDFVASTSGAIVGVALAWLVVKALQRGS